MKPYAVRPRSSLARFEFRFTQSTLKRFQDWILVFASFTGLMLIAKFGSIGALAFLLPWGIVALTKPQDSLAAMLRNAWVFALPFLCFISALWSDFPPASFRSAIQFLLTVAIGIFAGECIRPRVFVSSLFGALAFAATASLALGGNGLFASKNQLAQLGVFTALVSLNIALDRSQPHLLRFLSVAGTILGLYTIYAGNSAGSTVCSVPAILMAPLLATLSFLPGAARAAFVFVAALALLTGGLAAASLIGDSSAVYEALGKDATLTGRTELWTQAQALIWERPLLGTGYQAFWQAGNPLAVQLWIENHVPVGSGFNFHNLYFNTGVELGVLGLVLLAGLLLSAIGRLVLVLLGPMTSQQLLAASVFVYLFLISFVEVIQTYQFMLGTVLFYVAWCYLRPRWELQSRRTASGAAHFARRDRVVARSRC